MSETPQHASYCGNASGPDPLCGGCGMSETPQAVLERYIRDGGIITLPHIREAIRAVLAENKRRCHNVRGEDGPCDCAGCREVGALLAERDKWRDIAKAEVERLERARLRSADWLTIGKLEAERDALRLKMENAIQETEEWRETARNEMAGRAAAEAELRRAERFWASAQERADVANVALLDAVKVRGELRAAQAALGEVHNLTRSASDVFILRLGSIAAQALHPDWRDGGVTP